MKVSNSKSSILSSVKNKGGPEQGVAKEWTLKIIKICAAKNKKEERMEKRGGEILDMT